MGFAQIYGGNFSKPDATPLAGGELQLWLSGPATISGTSQIVSLSQLNPLKYTLDSQGSIALSDNVRVWTTDSLSPSGLVYYYQVLASDGTVQGNGAWSIQGASPINLATLVQSSSGVSFPGAVLLNPGSDQSIITGSLLPASGNANVTGQALGNSGAIWQDSYINLKIGNGIVYADQFSGSNIGQQINAAFAALPSSGGVVYATNFSGTQTATTQISIPASCQLFLGGFTLAVNAIILMANNSSIVGLGDNSILQASGMTATSTGVITNLGNSALNEGAATANSNIYLANFKVDCNSSGNPSATTVDGVWLANCTNCYAENVFVTGAKGASGCNFRIYSGSRNTLFRCVAESSANIGFNASLGSQWTFSHCLSTGNVGNGFDCGIGASQGRIVECEAKSNGGNGFNPDTAGDIEVTGGNFQSNTNYGIAVANAQHRVIINGARVYGNTLSGVFLNNSADTVTIGNCIISGNQQHGVLINSTGLCTVHDNIITDNSQQTANTYDGIRINSAGGNSLRNIITGNIIKNLAGTGQKYGINEDTSGGGSVGQNIIAFNNLFENQTSATNNLQSTDQVFGNRTDFNGTIGVVSPLALTGTISTYNNIATAGNGAVVVYAATSQKSESAADTNVLTYTPPATAGTYRINFTMAVSAQNTATLGWTATWKDSNGQAQAPTNLSLFTSGTAAPALTVTAATNGNYYGSAVVDVDNSATNIVVKLTFTGTSFTAKASATIEQLI